MPANYKTPRFRYGQVVECARMGDVRIVKLSPGPVPWPMGQRVDKSQYRPAMILYKDLARAVRDESSLTVQQLFGVGPFTVWKWRKALGVPANNAGTKTRRQELARTKWFKDWRAKGLAKSRDPVRRAKIAAARRGKPRPERLQKIMRTIGIGRPQSEETRAKRRAAHLARGTRPPTAGPAWAPWEDEALRTLPPTEAAKKTGRTLTAVYMRRNKLGMRDGRTNSGRRRKTVA